MKSIFLCLTALSTQVYSLGKNHYLFPNYEKVPHIELEVIEEGSGPLIYKGSDVEVHFEIFDENGEKIESTRDRGETFHFIAGIGQIALPGLDSHITFMKKGERCLMTLPPDIAFGKSLLGRRDVGHHGK